MLRLNNKNCQGCLLPLCTFVNQINLVECFSEIRKKFHKVTLQDLVRSFLKVVCLWPESQKKIIHALFLKNYEQSASLYYDSNFYYCYKNSQNYQHLPGKWWTANCSFRGNDLFSLVRAVNQSSEIDAFEFVAEILKVDFSQSQVTLSNESVIHNFIPNPISYPSNICRYYIDNLLGNYNKEYLFYNTTGTASFKLLEWEINNESVQLFFTLYEDEMTKKRIWEYIPPPLEYMIYNRHLIDKSKHKTVHIHDDIAEACLSNTEISTGTWAGDFSVYLYLDWSFLKGRNVRYLFNMDNPLSIQIGYNLLQMFKKFDTQIKLYPRNWPSIYICNGDKKTRAFKDPSWPEEISIEKFYKYAKWRHDIDLKFNEKEFIISSTSTGGYSDIKENKGFMVEPLFDEGSFVVLIATKKSGKTFVAIDISIMVATGESIGDRLFAKKAYKVLYIDSEMPENKFIKRINNLMINYKKNEIKDDYLVIKFLRDRELKIDLSTKEGQNYIHKQIKDARLIVFDNLGGLVPSKYEKVDEYWAKVSSWFKSLTSRGITVLLLHHENKEGDPRGTGKITDDADLVISLKKRTKTPNTNTSVEFHISESRFLYGKQCEPFLLEYCTNAENTETRRTVRSLNSDLTDNYKHIAFKENNYQQGFTEIEKELLDPTRHGENLYVKSGIFIVKGRSGRSQGTVVKALNKLCKSGLLIKTGNTPQGTRYVLKENWNEYCEKYSIAKS